MITNKKEINGGKKMFQIFSNDHFPDDQQFNVSNLQLGGEKKTKEKEELSMAWFAANIIINLKYVEMKKYIRIHWRRLAVSMLCTAFRAPIVYAETHIKLVVNKLLFVRIDCDGRRQSVHLFSIKGRERGRLDVIILVMITWLHQTSSNRKIAPILSDNLDKHVRDSR